MGKKGLIGPKKEWTEEEYRELLGLYVDGASPTFMAQLFSCKTSDIVKELSALVLNADHVESNPLAPNYGNRWSWGEEDFLQRELQLRTPIAKIARFLGRDDLGVAFKILEKRPQLPRRTIEKFQLGTLSNAKSPLEGDQPKFVLICSTCDDVVLYCKCDHGNI